MHAATSYLKNLRPRALFIHTVVPKEGKRTIVRGRREAALALHGAFASSKRQSLSWAGTRVSRRLARELPLGRPHKVSKYLLFLVVYIGYSRRICQNNRRIPHAGASSKVAKPRLLGGFFSFLFWGVF